MAEKIGNSKAAERQAEEAVRELGVISPERKLPIAGRMVEMREPTWIESLELDHLLEPVVETLIEIFGDKIETPSWGKIGELMRRHADVMLDMMALCSGCDRTWISKLNDQDGQRFAALFWAVNGHFFGRRVLLSRAHHAAGAERAGQTSARH